MSGGRTLALCLLLLLGFGVADYSTLAGTEMAETTFDSGILLRVANRSALDPAFYHAKRPMTVPLLYKAVGGDPDLIRVLHSVFSIAGWFSLGLALAGLFRPAALRVAVLVGTCLFSLSSPINQWDGALMTESLFLSFMAATIALTIVGAKQLVQTGGVSMRLALCWFVVALLFAGCRDSAQYLLAIPWVAGAVLFAVRMMRGAPRSGIGIALVLGLAILLAAQTSLRHSQRWHTPLVNVMLQRILPDAELHESWVERYGLPRNALFEAQAGKLAWNRVPDGVQLRKLLESDPRLAEVEHWLQTRGVSAYQRHLILDQPLRSAKQAIEAWSLGLNPAPPVGPGPREGSYSRGAGITSWSRVLTRVAYFPIFATFWVGIGALCTALTFCFTARGSRASSCCVLLLLAGAATQAFVTWHGDTAELARHTMVVGVLARLAIGLLVAVVIERIDERRR